MQVEQPIGASSDRDLEPTAALRACTTLPEIESWEELGSGTRIGWEGGWAVEELPQTERGCSRLEALWVAGCGALTGACMARLAACAGLIEAGP